MNSDQLGRIMPLCDVAKWIQPLSNAMVEFDIDTKLSKAAFLANIAVESNQLRTLEENLNYSADGLAKTWPSRFALPDGKPNNKAFELHRQPEKIANYVYANRMGNLEEYLGHGFKYRGRGLIQITGLSMYAEVARVFDLDRTSKDIGAFLLSTDGAARSAAWFFKNAGCKAFADKNDFDGVCDKINLGHKTLRAGDSVGYLNKLHFYETCLEELS